MGKPPLLAAGLVLGWAVTVAGAQSRFILADRTSDALWTLHDANGNGVIDEPGEVFLFFNAANAAGTLGPQNITSLAVHESGTVLFGDQLNRNVYLLRDLNNDGDARDAGESRVLADAANASGFSFAFPTGAGFDAAGRAYIGNAGNAFGSDALVRLGDANADGDAQDAGEIEQFVADPFFGPGNGPYGPQEFLFDAADACYVHNSSTGIFAVFRFADLDSDGRADGPGEATLFWDGTNADGVPSSAGFALDADRDRPGALYVQQTGSGSNDQIVRVRDNNDDRDAQDAGESELVYATVEAGFIVIDLLCLRDGRLLLTDNSGKKIYRLTDLDGDGRFSTAGERDVYFDNVVPTVGDLRQIAVLPLRAPADMNCDGAVDFFDIDPFLGALFDAAGYAAAYPDCNRHNADCNLDFAVDFFDIDAFLALLFG